MREMVFMRSRHRRGGYCLWLFGILVLSLVILRIAFKQGSPLKVYFKSAEDPFAILDSYTGQKPTLCPPVREGDLQPARVGVKYGRPIMQKKHVMYTSVPKCGSRSLIWVMWELLGRFNSSDIKDFEYRLDDSTPEKEKAILNNYLSQPTRPTFFHAHQRFLDYEGDEGPVYISIIREPVSRFVSWYYFMRHGDADMNDTEMLQKMLGSNAALPNETIDDCFNNKRNDCTGDYYFTLNINIFCGYDKRCSQNRAFALTQAKRNLDKYLVVGIMEEYEDTVRVLETLMPSTFGGGPILYKKIQAESASISKTKFKAATSPETLALMKEKMREDIEFYEHARQKFHDLKVSLKIGTTRNC